MKLKKSESLEIRIPYPTKEAFMAKCRDNGHSASEALRRLIDLDLNEAVQRRAIQRGRLRLVVGGVIALAVGAVAVPTLARTTMTAEFSRLDTNGDGVVTFQEYSQHQGAIGLIAQSVKGR